MSHEKEVSTFRMGMSIGAVVLVMLLVVFPLARPVSIWAVYGDWVIASILFPFAITIGQYIVGAIGESRWIPSFTIAQWRAFMPGDLLLDLSMVLYAALLWGFVPKSVTERATGSFWHLVVIVITLSVGIFMTVLEDKDNAYGRWALLSPTKLYHNLVIIPLSAYLVGMFWVIMFYAGPGWWWFLVILATGPIVGWATTMFLENKNISAEMKTYKCTHAHISDWKVINLERAKALVKDLMVWLTSSQSLE